MNAVCARGLAAAALALLLGSPALGAAARGPDERIAAIGEAFLALRAASPAQLARRPGSPADAPLAPAVTPSARAREVASLRGLRARLA